jgi:hypothetical protein
LVKILRVEILEVEKLKGFKNWDREDRIDLVRNKLRGIVKKLRGDLELIGHYEEVLDQGDRDTVVRFGDRIEGILEEN